MHTRTSTALLLTTILTSTTAFIPIQPESAAPFPPDLDPALWAPLTTFIVPLASLPTSTAVIQNSDSLSTPTATHSSEPQDQHPELKERQVTGQGAAAAAATAADQISPVTTYQANILVDGTPVQSNVVYTQLFSAVPDPWPSPTSQGVIGLGTIQGTVGVVKTKRDLPPVQTQEAFLVGVEKDSELVVVPDSGDDNQAEGAKSGGGRPAVVDVVEPIQEKLAVANAANGRRLSGTTTSPMSLPLLLGGLAGAVACLSSSALLFF